MQENLTKLANELRKETCPQRVRNGVVRRIEAETPPLRSFRYAISVGVAGVVLLFGLLVWWRLPGVNAGRQPDIVQQQSPGHIEAQTARDTKRALGLIASVLLDAGAHSETVISDRAVPPLRNGLETAKNKLIHYTELDL